MHSTHPALCSQLSLPLHYPNVPCTISPTPIYTIYLTLTLFGAPRSRPEGAPSSPLDFPTHRIAVNTCRPVYCGTRGVLVVVYLTLLMRLIAPVLTSPTLIISTLRLASTSAESRRSVVKQCNLAYEKWCIGWCVGDDIIQMCLLRGTN